MKKIFLLIGLITTIWISNAINTDASTVLWLNINNFTKYSTLWEFRAQDPITRWEASKFVVKFAELNNLKKIKNHDECNFLDITDYDYTLKDSIIEACEYGLFKGSNWNYMPNNLISKWEAITVVMRSLEWMKNETINPRYSNYYQLWSTINLSLWDINEFENPITRIMLGLRLKETFEYSESIKNNNIDSDAEVVIEDSNDENIETLEDWTRVYRNSVCDHVYYRWPKWGCYYINDNDVKIYDTSKKCCSNM